MSQMERLPNSCENDAPPSRVRFLDVTVLVLSVYVLGAMLVQAVCALPPAAGQMLDRIDALVCVVFLTDFAVRFRRAPSKARFMRWGWIDLVSSIPAWDVLRWGQLARVARIFRVLRAFRSARHLAGALFRRRHRSLALTALLTSFVLVTFASIAVLACETEPESNIRTPFDALWWAVTTMTTVGYGDRYPVTVEGKIVAMILMIAGVGLFGVLTGLFARLFVEPDLRREDADIATLAAEIRRLREQIESDAARREEAAPRE